MYGSASQISDRWGNNSRDEGRRRPTAHREVTLVSSTIDGSTPRPCVYLKYCAWSVKVSYPHGVQSYHVRCPVVRNAGARGEPSCPPYTYKPQCEVFQHSLSPDPDHRLGACGRGGDVLALRPSTKAKNLGCTISAGIHLILCHGCKGVILMDKPVRLGQILRSRCRSCARSRHWHRLDKVMPAVRRRRPLPVHPATEARRGYRFLAPVTVVHPPRRSRPRCHSRLPRLPHASPRPPRRSQGGERKQGHGALCRPQRLAGTHS